MVYLTNSCLKLNATSVLLSTNILTGLLNETEARSLTASVIVAENNIVCLVGEHILIISFIWSAKFSSNILSASSKTNTSKSDSENDGVFCKWSNNRPGVAITISGFLRSMDS